MKPINNKTQLNSTLFTFTSSGAIDVVMPLYPENKRDYKQSPYRSKSDKNNRW